MIRFTHVEPRHAEFGPVEEERGSCLVVCSADDVMESTGVFDSVVSQRLHFGVASFHVEHLRGLYFISTRWFPYI